MRTIIACGGAALFTLVTGCASAPSVETAADSAAVRGLGEKFETAWNAGDVAALGQLVAEDYHAVETDGTVIEGRAAYEAMEKTAAEGRKAAGLALDIVPVHTTFLSGTSAISAGTWTMKGVPAGGGPDRGSYLVSSVKGSDGMWRLKSALAAAFIAPPPAPAVPPGKGG